MSKLSKLAALKIIFERGRNYASIAQFVLIIFLAVRELQRTNLGVLIPRTALAAPVGLILALVLVMIIGYFDYKFIYGKEQERAAWKNPVTQAMLKKLDKLEKSLIK
jgi:p-aminobenzoyl-glutamate transporter AbgT